MFWGYHYNLFSVIKCEVGPISASVVSRTVRNSIVTRKIRFMPKSRDYRNFRIQDWSVQLLQRPCGKRSLFFKSKRKSSAIVFRALYRDKTCFLCVSLITRELTQISFRFKTRKMEGKLVLHFYLS